MILRTTSHRARSKVAGILGGHPQFYFTFEDGGCFLKVDDSEKLARILKVKGVSKCRCQDDEKYMKCC